MKNEPKYNMMTVKYDVALQTYLSMLNINTCYEPCQTKSSEFL